MLKSAVSAFVALFALSSAPALAHEHFPEGTLLALEGQDPAHRKECALYVTDIGYTGPERSQDQWYAKVQTSFNHDGAKASPMVVKATNKPGTLVGKSENGHDTIVIYVKSQGTDLQTASSFRLAWKHDSHTHNSVCDNLSVHRH